MSNIDCYRYKAEGTLHGAKFKHEGTVYAENAWDAAELAEADARSEFPGVILKDDDPERGVTGSPKVYVTRDIVNESVSRARRSPLTGSILREELPVEFKPNTSDATEL